MFIMITTRIKTSKMLKNKQYQRQSIVRGTPYTRNLENVKLFQSCTFKQEKGLQLACGGHRTAAGTLRGVYIHIFMFCPTSFFQIDQLEFDSKTNSSRRT